MTIVLSKSFSRNNVLISFGKWPFAKLILASAAFTVNCTPRNLLQTWTSRLPLTSKITTCCKTFFYFFCSSLHICRNCWPKFLKLNISKNSIFLRDNNLETKGITKTDETIWVNVLLAELKSDTKLLIYDFICNTLKVH